LKSWAIPPASAHGLQLLRLPQRLLRGLLALVGTLQFRGPRHDEPTQLLGLTKHPVDEEREAHGGGQ